MVMKTTETMTMSKDAIKYAVLFFSFLILISCGEEEKKADGNSNEVTETMDSGELKVYCDESIYEVMDSAFYMYNEFYPKVKFSSEVVHSRKAMSLLLSGNARAIVIARDYLKDEDSLMEAYGVEEHLRMKIAEDALVFYTQPDFPVDTLNATEIKDVLLNKKKMKDIYPQLKSEPQFVINDPNSSEYSNLRQIVLDNQFIKHSHKILDGHDSVKYYVKNKENSIGIGYLSHVVKNPDYKKLRIGFTDSTGNHEMPQAVHQAYIVMRRYPFIVDYYVYLFQERRDLSYWFATYMAKEARVQKYFKQYGIVPAFAKFKLIKQ